jgi:hypothetical protein
MNNNGYKGLRDEKFEIYQKLKIKADKIKNDIGRIKRRDHLEIKNLLQDNEEKFQQKTYDQFKLKQIIKENLLDLKNRNFLSENNKYEDFINEEININDYINTNNKESLNESKFNESIKIIEPSPTCLEELSQLEMSALNKAKELESQINLINQRRMQLVIKDFREKLLEENQLELNKFESNLLSEYKAVLQNLHNEHSEKLENINILQSKLNQLQDYIKEINQELREEKIELNSAFEKYLTTVDHEKNLALEKYKSDMNNFVENRVEEFRNHLRAKIISNDFILKKEEN